jgi:hypothetical protein
VISLSSWYLLDGGGVFVFALDVFAVFGMPICVSLSSVISPDWFRLFSYFCSKSCASCSVSSSHLFISEGVKVSARLVVSPSE